MFLAFPTRNSFIRSKTMKLQRWRGKSIMNQNVVLFHQNGVCARLVTFYSEPLTFLSTGKRNWFCGSFAHSGRTQQRTHYNLCVMPLSFLCFSAQPQILSTYKNTVEQKMIWEAEDASQRSTRGEDLCLPASCCAFINLEMLNFVFRSYIPACPKTEEARPCGLLQPSV